MTNDDIETIDQQNQYQSEIKQELKRLRLSPEALCRYIETQHSIELPRGIFVRFVEGRRSDIPSGVLREITHIISRLPDPPRVSRPSSKKDNIAITPEMRDALIQGLEQSGLSPGLLIRRGAHLPPGLTAAKISNWKTGRAKMANSEEWYYVMEALGSSLKT